MKWKKGQGADMVCCPVCTLYLRKEVTLQEHLDTHPKQQVIEALVRVKDVFSQHTSLTATSNRRSFPSPDLAASNLAPSAVSTIAVANADPTDNATPMVVSSSPEAALTTVSQLQVAAGSANHFLYPQFLSSIGGGPVVPQYVSLVASAEPGSASQASNQPQVMQMLYSPYMYPSAPPGTSPEQLQYMTASNMMRSPFHILQTSSGTPSAQGPNPSTSGPLPLPMSMAMPIPHLAQGIQLQQALPHGLTLSQPIPQALSQPQLISQGQVSSFLPLNEAEEASHASQPEDLSQEVEEEQTPADLSRTSEDEIVNVSSQHDEEANVGWNLSQKELEVGSPPKCRVKDWCSLGSPGAHSTCSIEGGLRVRTDLSVSSVASPSPPVAAPEEEQQEMEFNRETTESETPHESSRSPKTFNSGGDKPSLAKRNGYVEPTAYTSQDNSSQVAHSGYIIETEGRTLFNLSSTNGAVNVQVEGLNVLLPTQYAEASNSSLASSEQQDQLTDPLSPVEESGSPSPYPKPADSPAVPSLNIQTDETMPPHGELSEQESNGGNSSSMWSVPPYQMTRELLSPVVSTSYDLIARESWPGSDISDNEGNANHGSEHSIYRYNIVSSFSNTLPSIISRPATNNSSDGKPTQARGKGQGGNKSTPRPKIYKCKSCTLEFNCPKERRVHTCTKIKEACEKPSPVTNLANMEAIVDVDSAGSSRSDEKLVLNRTKTKRTYKRKPKTVVKKEVVLEDQPPRFAEVFLKAGNIKKLESEAEEPNEIQTPTQAMSELSESLLKPKLSIPSEVQGGNPISNFVELPQFLLDQKPDMKQFFKVHKCTKCGESYPTGKDLMRHRSLKHKDQRYQCGTCGNTFDKERDYLDHLMFHPLECNLCGKSFYKRKSLNLHMKWHMDVKPYKCISCDKSFVTKQKLDEHSNTHTGNAPLKCSVCDETFKRYSNLIQHKNRHHLNVKKKVRDYICPCGEVYHSKKKLEWHKEIHDGKPKSCQYCSERFVHTVSLTRHVRKAHDHRYVPKAGRETENVECPVCHCVFLRSSLVTHMKIHTGERPYSCPICGKDFTTKWNLQLHRWTHASRSSKPFKCTLCKAAFYRKQDYNCHMRSHRNVRPFTCNHCGSQFIRKYNCLRHMREHEIGKSYTCEVCQKTFHRSYYLKDHMRVHSGARPYTCHICGKASTTKSNHNKHVKIHHAREPQNTEV